MIFIRLILLSAIFFLSIPTNCRTCKTFQIPQNSTEIIIEKGDITQSHVEIIVNAANEQLSGGGGVCGAIFTAAGWDKLQSACNKYPATKNGIRCPAGEVCITDSFNLATTGIKQIIHAVGPDCRIITNTAQQNNLLANAYKNSLLLAQQLNAQSIAFPFISSAIYACPKKQAAHTAVKTVHEYILNYPNTSLKAIHFVLFSQEDFDLFYQTTSKLLSTDRPTMLEKFIQYLKSYFA